MKIRLGTFNILNTSCRYLERKDLIVNSIKEMNCEILGLQEINFEENSKILQNDEYNLEFVSLPTIATDIEPEFRIDGNALLIKKDIEIMERHKLVYSINEEVAQILKLRKQNYEFIAVNTHLDYLTDATREIQLRELLKFLENFYEFPIICTGDYNFTPDSIPYAIMREQFNSIYLYCNKKEPEITFPTGLLGEFADIDECGCFDYLWFRGNIKPTHAEVYRNCGVKEVWASDHYPLFCDLEFL